MQLKRGFDVCVAAIAVAGLAPLWLIVAALITMESRGPVIFRQKRSGRFGREFTLYKFRSMKIDSDAAVDAEQRAAAADGVLVKKRDDPRVTTVGRFLRRTSLDELPQLFNVLKGDMSLVGPRPLMTFMLAPCGELASVRGLVRPGLTGLWQIRDRENNTSAAAMLPHDLEYIGRFDLTLDLLILCQTPGVVISARGAV